LSSHSISLSGIQASKGTFIVNYAITCVNMFNFTKSYNELRQLTASFIQQQVAHACISTLLVGFPSLGLLTNVN